MEPEGLTTKPWYQGKWKREDAEAFLAGKPNGTFVVRASSQKDRLALSHTHHSGSIVHAIIEVSWKGYCLREADRPEVWHPTVTKLLSSFRFTFFDPATGKSYLPDGTEATPP
uniref:SH2 domain-containing protein n=1 Tax=Sexangularia sp. CB-2014 TaxID=1486929 RepID=A0A7S1VEB8_9EUKA|mmetsp:Transcript_1606/g.5150  ORF Transcript_1606/g.5150 Transcript_1606/m.5150 type:complete len:113 (+) Transcript_1606:254-592(+)|eukprot:CAMPEP_0170744352 /NCGR_PEP_ID=MMETSP0437-20130122/7738_1 /TAXON_ID=0 /ORGANISM="Sexangularia sp." /LENGTH=112 /DNA_ID=CAMNT_0011083047 /DNA_START=55 /DNA_END=396 /DNA_ORIENTATION=-